MTTANNLTCVKGNVCELKCLQVSSNPVGYQEIQLAFISFHLIISSFLSHSYGRPFKKVRKKDGLWSVQKYLAADGIVVIQRLISPSHYSASDIRPPQVVLLHF